MRLAAVLVAVMLLVQSSAALARGAVVEAVSPLGTPFWLAEDHAVPVIALEMMLPGGARLDPPGSEGATSLMTALLDQGTALRDGPAFVEATERLAAHFGFGAGQDHVRVSAMMLAANRDATVDLLAEAMQRPAFDAEAVERTRAQVLASLRQAATDPSSVAQRAFFRALLGGHPYALLPSGTEDSVAGLDIAALRAAHGRTLVRAGAAVVVAGAIGEAEAGAMIDRLLAPLPAAGPPAPPAATIRSGGGVEVVPVAGPQSVLVFGHAGIDETDPDYIPAMVMMHILGSGGFSSRLIAELRERHGLAYGAFAGLSHAELADMVIGSVATANRTAGECVALIRAAWQQMRGEGVSAAELAAAKQYLTGAYPLQFDGNAAIASILVALKTEGRSPDWPETRSAAIEAVTADDIRRVARRLLQPEALTFVIAGAPEGLPPE